TTVPRKPEDQRRLTASVGEDIEFDSNILNENSKTAEPTNAKALKFTTVGNLRYRLYDRQWFYFHPGSSLSFTKHLSTKSSAKDDVAKSDALVVSPVFYMG